MRIMIYMHTNHKYVIIKQTSMATGDVLYNQTGDYTTKLDRMTEYMHPCVYVNGSPLLER